MTLHFIIALGIGQLALVAWVLYYQIKMTRFDAFLQPLQQQNVQSEQRLQSLLQDMSRHQLESNQQIKANILAQGMQLQQMLLEKFTATQLQSQQAFSEHRTRFDERQLATHKIMHDTLQKGMQETRKEVKEALTDYAEQFGKRVETLTQTTDLRLKEINQQVEKRLTAGLEKTNETFSDIIKRLALIDAAQKQIAELSTNVVSLQEILNDKRSRGAFGEVQLSALIRNVMPEQHFAFQHSLSNGLRADCILFLPAPTGNIVIDSKFPLENYRISMDTALSESERTQAKTQFKKDIKKHIQDIAEKYIIAGETSDGAVMFIPAEAIFAEIHGSHPDLVELAHRAKIWMVSPTTMMAILTTARAVLKDAATRKQLYQIQEHLRLLGSDFGRFQKRMDSLALRIEQAHSDVTDVHTSAKKITKRFELIDKVELENHEPTAPAIPAISTPDA